jgi:UDP-N-acetylglucosamine 2-epimerase (non-hydrolysing)
MPILLKKKVLYIFKIYLDAMKIMSIVGTRPNFMKVAPVYRELKKRGVPQILVHTGQHYDKNMSGTFLEELRLPKPDIYLGVEHGTRIHECAEIMERFEKILEEEKPALVLVVGDVTSTFSCAEVAKDHQIPIAHIEAGLRSHDETMPEEVNRILTDKISNFLFVTERGAIDNLKKEGFSEDKIFFVGNVMIDSLLIHKKEAAKKKILQECGLSRGKFIVLTLHRPKNVDDKDNLLNILGTLNQISQDLKVFFPVHPRTRNKIHEFEIEDATRNMVLSEPLGYLEFLNAVMNSKCVITDSGGIEAETTMLDIPCITLRDTCEMIVTITDGTNVLVGNDMAKLRDELARITRGDVKHSRIPEMWDGHAAQRIVDILLSKIKL